jgi:uncharacterized protein YkwD
MKGSITLTLTVAAAVLASASALAFDATVPRLATDLPPPIAVEPDERAAPAKIRSTWEQEVVELVNQQRWNNGQLPPLKRVDLLDSSSELHSTNMAQRDFMAHCDPDTLTLPGDRMIDAGYNWSSAAENIAAGYSSPAAVIAGWMGSSGHRANILSTTYRELGVGYVYQSNDAGNVVFDRNGDCVPDDFNNGPYYHYWTQNFGMRNTVYPVVIEREAETTSSADVDLYLYGTGWASQMRLRNESGTWTVWQSFTANVAWQLSPGPGFKEVFVEIRNGGTVRSASDTIESTAAAPDEIFTDGFESGDTAAWGG